MKKVLSLLVALALMLPLAACHAPEAEDDLRPQIVATLFPQYDFARNLVGEECAVTLLLPPGTEAHAWEPTPADIIKISECDLFIYTGADMEAWAADILKAVEGVKVLDLSAVLDLSCFEEHDHSHEVYDHGEHSHEHEPHYWCDPVLASQMVESIAKELAVMLPDSAGDIEERRDAYLAELAALDGEFRAIAAEADSKTIYHGGKFAFYYFAHEYGFDYLAAYDSCIGESEPSAAVVASLIDAVKAGDAGAIFYEELTDPKVARAISEECGVPMLLLHSCHNLTADEIAAGEDYLSLMKQNAANLRSALCR